MAASLAAAIKEVEGPEFDLIVGYSIPPREHALTEEAIRAAFEEFDYRHVRRIARRLSAHHRCHETHAEDAVHDALLALLVRRPDLYRKDPTGWLGLLHSTSHFRLLRIKFPAQRTESIEGLAESARDTALNAARPCVPPLTDSSEESRYAPLPERGEGWNRTQIIGAIQRFRDYHGHPPRASDCRALNRLPSSATINRHFGDFASAILAAGMVPDTLGRRKKSWSAIEAARACRAFRKRHGYWPNWADARRNPGDLPGRGAMMRFFGSTQPSEVQLGAEAILGWGH